MEQYEALLGEAYGKIKVVEASSERFEVPKVKGEISGKNTIILNIKDIASYLRRPLEHLAKFLMKELATPGKIENERLVLNRKLNSNLVNEKISFYAKDFVICQECKKPDTEIVSEKGIKLKHCLACGAKTPVRGNA